MPTGREAEAPLATLTGIPLMRVATTTRILRETSALSGYDYWLRAGRGIRDAAVLPHHIVNATLALMVQPSDGPALIQGLRRLELTTTTERTRNQVNALLGGKTTYTERLDRPGLDESAPPLFGVMLDGIVFAFSGRRRSGDADLARLVLNHPPLVRIRLGASLSAEVVWASADGVVEYLDAFATPAGTLPGLDLPLAENGLFDRIIEISAHQFRRMADIVGAEANQPLLISGGGNASPESETAADHPLPGTGAAALDDQPAQTELDGSSQHHSRDEREKSQLSSDSRAGDLQSSWSGPRHARSNDDHRRKSAERRIGAAGRAVA